MRDRARWWVLLGCLVCQMGLGLGGYVFAVFLKPVVAEMGWSRTAFAAAGGPLLLAMALASPLVGALTERVGARVVFTGAITLVAAALLGLSVMQSLWAFYVLGFVLGTGITGLGDVPAGGVVSAWFGRRRGLALGLVFVGSNLGGALVPLVAAAVAETSGWRVALRVLAVGGWLLIVPFALWAVRDRPAATRDLPEVPADTLEGATLGEALRTPAFWILAGVLFSFYVYYLGVNHHLVAYLTDVGFTDAAAARRFAWAIAVGVAGKIGIGLVADRIPVHRAALLTFGLLTAGSLVLLAVGDWPALLPVFLTVHGLTVAAENVMLPLLVAWCFGTRHLTRIYGALMLALLPGGFLGAVFAAWVQDQTGRYLPAFVTFAVLNVAALAALATLRAAPRAAE